MDHAIARALRQSGIDVTSTADAGLLGSDDSDHLAHARREGRVIVTDDYDFLRAAAASPDHAGVAFCHKGRLTLGQIIDGLTLIHGVLTPEEMRVHVEYV